MSKPKLIGLPGKPVKADAPFWSKPNAQAAPPKWVKMGGKRP